MDTKQILNFLEQLREHNNKSWMEANKAVYLQAKNTLIAITDSLIQAMSPIDRELAKLSPQSCLFRINRDIRFSKNKAPYKHNLGIYITREGRHSGYAGYYLHIEPRDRSFVGGSLYHPESKILKQVRQEIDYNAEEFIQIINDASFKRFFDRIEGEKLQKPPQGYKANHPYIELLKLKSFTVLHPIQDSALIQEDFLHNIVQVFRAMVPFNQFLNAAVKEKKTPNTTAAISEIVTGGTRS